MSSTPEGIGIPPADHPDFAAPAPSGRTQPGPAAPGPVAPGPVAPGTAEPGWPVAPVAVPWAPPPPSGRGPEPAHPRRTRLLAGIVALAVLAGALVGVLAMLPRGNSASSPTPGAEPTATTASASPAPGGTGTGSVKPSANPEPTRLATVSPTAAPATAVAVQGADLGPGKAFRTATGEGEAFLQNATWTNRGDIAPLEGSLYLVLTVSVAGRTGLLPLDALSFRAVAADGSAHSPGFGPALETPLGGSTIAAGVTATGQIGFALPPGTATIELLDADLLPVADFEVPGP